MIDPNRILSELVNLEYKKFIGVADSTLGGLIVEIESSDCDYIPATNEGEAVAISAGKYVSGARSVVILQNSGLGNLVNPVTSLNHIFKIPLFLIIGHRGYPGMPDEPQHEVMGKITTDLLSELGIQYRYIDNSDIQSDIIWADSLYKTGNCVALIVKPGVLKKSSVNMPQPGMDTNFPNRFDVIKLITEIDENNSRFIATTGKISRELYTIADSARNIYVVGSMGFASAFAFGIASESSERMIILDGDGAALMHMGNIATIGSTSCNNLIHVVIDNEVYESTGCQRTISSKINFTKIASACGYDEIHYVDSIKKLNAVFQIINEKKSKHFVHVKVSSKQIVKDLARPTISPPDVLKRFMNS